MMDAPSLPDPDPSELERSRRLSALLRAEIAAAGGVLGFDRFMQLALYAPGLGYYAADNAIFGAGGDFRTAAEAGELFAACCARQCADILAETAGEVVEFGAGSGRFAAHLLSYLARIEVRPRRYHIVEASDTLAARQRGWLAAQPAAQGVEFVWHAQSLRKPVKGVVIANEVLDAFPVARFVVRGARVDELAVTVCGDSFAWCARPNPSLPAALRGLAADCGDGYVSEYCAQVSPWLNELANMLVEGIILVCDYGYPRHEYFHPARRSGTLKCHYRHRVHDDPFFLPGLQDITAAVDFTALADVASACGLTVAGYTTQAHFLLACGIEQALACGSGDALPNYRLAQEAKLLLLPGGMGQTCKVMALATRAWAPLRGFVRDERQRLMDFA